MSRKPGERRSTLEAHTYGYAIRAALRRCGIYLKDTGSNRSAAIILPPGADFDAYEEALGYVLKEAGMKDRFAVARVVLGKRGDTYSTEAVQEVSRWDRVIVIVESGAAIPRGISVAVDRIVEVGPIRPHHLVAAAKQLWQITIEQNDARQLCSHRPTLLFSALRQGRPIAVSLTKLGNLPVTPRDTWEPTIEMLEGYGPAKDWALELVQDLDAWREGSLSWRDVDAGLLLSGPPGTGKTLFASALARSCGATFMPTSSARWQSRGHLGDMLGAMRRSFREAAEQAPTVLFIDEFDSLGDRRTFRGDNVGYSMQVVNALLELLDGSGGREGVIVVAASNYPENIDPALLRPGRLDRHVAIGLPDRATREQMLGLHLDHAIPKEHLRDIASAIGGYSAAHIEQLARDARRLARRAGRDVDTEDLVGLIPPLVPLRGEERLAVCVHEAGHAIVGLEFNYGTIDVIVVAREFGHRDGSAAHVQWSPTRTKNRSRQSYLDCIAMLLGGMAAERVILGSENDGSGGMPGSDLQLAVDLATRMLASLGLGSLQYYEVSTSGELEELRRSDPDLRRRVETLLEEQLKRAEEVIRGQRRSMDAVIAELLDREVVPGQEILRLLGKESGDQSAA